MNRYAQVDAVILDHIQVGFASGFAGRGLRPSPWLFLASVGASNRHYRLLLPCSWDEFANSGSSESIKKIERRERALGRETGKPTRLIEIRSLSDAEPYGREIERLMNTTWQARHLGHCVNLNGMREVAGHGWLRSFLLMSGDHAVAFALGYQGMGGYISNKSDTTSVRQAFAGNDSALPSHSPFVRSRHAALVDFGEGMRSTNRFLPTM